MRKMNSLIIFVLFTITSVNSFAGRNTMPIPKFWADRIVSLNDECSGTFLTPSVIVTAHHCLGFLKEHLNAVPIRVSSGRTQIFSILDITSFSKCPLDNSECLSTDDDVVLIMGKFVDLDFHKTTGLEFMPVKFQLPLVIENFKLVSLNTNYYFAGQGVDKKEETTINTAIEIPIRYGSMVYRGIKMKSLATLKFEANASNQAQCSGDSGGPVFNYDGRRIILFGIVSRAYSKLTLGVRLGLQKVTSVERCNLVSYNYDVSLSHYYDKIVAAYDQWNKGLYYLKSEDLDPESGVTSYLRSRVKFNEAPPPLRR